MKKFRKLMALILSVLMTVSCLSGMVIVSAGDPVDPNSPVNVETFNMWKGAQIGPHGKYLARNSFGAKITVPEGKRVVNISISNLAFYSDGDNKVNIKVFKWKGDYATSIDGKILAEADVTDHANNTTLSFDLPNHISAEGEILYQVTYLSGPDGMTPWKAEGAADGVAYFSNGGPSDPFFFTVSYADRLEGYVEEEEETVDPLLPVNVEEKALFSGNQTGPAGYFGGGTGVGVKIAVPAGRRMISFKLNNMATYSNSVNKISVKVYGWNTNYATTVAGEVLAETVMVDHEDNSDLVYNFPNNLSLEGEILVTVNYIEGETGLTPWSVDGAPAEGVTYFANDTECGPFKVSATFADALPDMKMYAEIDFGKYVNDPATVYNFNSVNGVTFPEVCDQGYISLTSTSGDPYFQIHDAKFDAQLAATTSDKTDFVVIKYRTDKIDRAEFYVCRTDGVGYANPMDKSHVGYTYIPDGNWHTVIVDASEVWGNVEGVSLQNLRFDFGNQEGTVDVAYLRFYATREGADACVAAEQGTWTETVMIAVDDANIHQGDDGRYYYGEENIPLTHIPADGNGEGECYAYEIEKTGVVAPKIPFNPDNMDLKHVYDGLALVPSNVGNTESAVYDYDKGYATYVAAGDDPQINLDAAGLEVGPYMVIKYRTGNITTSDAMECFIGAGAGPQGPTDNKQWSFIHDGEWHTAVIYIGDLQDYNNETNVINHFRFDYLRGANTSAGESVDVEYIAFFGDKDSAEFYAESDLHVPPVKPVYTVTFVADGIEIAVVEYTQGDTELTTVPTVPAKEGYTGEWESYTLNNTNLTVNAVYTEISDQPTDTQPGEDDTDEPGDDTDEPGDDTPAETDPVEDPTTPAESDDDLETETEIDTDVSGPQGCASVVGMGAVAIFAAAAVVALKKKED